jgi:transcription antitermination factor NusG
MEGYVFIKDCLEARQGINNLYESKVFSGALFYSGKYQTVSSEVIKNLKKKLRNSLKKKMANGTKVLILGGIFKNLTGEVIGVEDGGKKIMVNIKRISREMVAPIPSTLLKEV